MTNEDAESLHDQQRRSAQLQILPRLRDAEWAAKTSADTNTNTYKVVVVASDDAPGAAVVDGADVRKKAYEKVTVMVTDVDEPGMVTLSAEQPQASVELTATLNDDDATAVQVTAAKWKWEHSSAAAGPWTTILTADGTVEYTPLGVEDKYLRVTATYIDKHDPDKTAQAVSANMVRAAPDANNAAPVFTDENLDTGEKSPRLVEAWTRTHLRVRMWASPS